MYVYGGFTVLTIAAFGVLTLLLHGEMLRGDRAATALAVFIAVYWTARIAVDFFLLRSPGLAQRRAVRGRAHLAD